MKMLVVTTVRMTTTEPYTQLPRDRIELQLTPAGMIFLPNKAALQERHPNFWKILVTRGIHLHTDPAQLDAPLLATLRDKVGIRLETSDIPQAAALLDLSEEDPIFKATHTQAKPYS
jgi:hypothetical protein